MLHLVWRTWDRLPLIAPEIEREIFRYIETTCIDNKCRVLAINGMPDHVHLFVKFPSTITIADLVRCVKGGSSRFVSETLKPGEWFKWQGHYYVAGVSPSHKIRTIKYIENQAEHHFGRASR